VKTYILKYNVSNSIDLTTKHLDFETLHYHFGYTFDKVMCYILNNIEDAKKIYFPTQKYVCYSCILRKIHQHSFSENYVHSNKSLRLIYLDLLKLSTLSYSKYR